MRVFVRVVEAGSFTAAAQHLNTTIAYASRAVSDLEAHLRTRLLNRTTRRIALTEAGERYLRRCAQILAYVDEAEAEADGARMHPSGTLRIHAMATLGTHCVVPAIGHYQQRYPDVHVELTLAQRVPDLLDEGYDVSIILGYDLPGSGFVSQRLGRAFSIACASPAYLERHGVPKTPTDLERHTCLHMVAPPFSTETWTFDGPHGVKIAVRPPAVFQANVTEAVAMAVREGMGIGVLPTYSVLPWLTCGELAWVLPEYTAQPLTVYALYPSRQYLDAKIRTWVDFLQAELPARLETDYTALRQFAHIYSGCV